MSMKDDSACLDADTLAAWADQTLDARERKAVETHAADCERCQALLAAMVTTMPEPAAAPWRWRMPALGWLVPIAAAATAVAIWVAVPNRAPVQHSQSAEAALDQPEAAPVPPAAAPAKATAAAEPGAQSELARAQDANAPPSADLKERRESASLGKQVSPAEANARSDTAGAARAAAPAASPPPPPSPAAPARLSAFANAADTMVVSSNPATRFRLLPGGGVQRSADGGATWRSESSGATATLTAGSSPSPSVCWLVGPSGTVLLSTGGSSWRRLAFPERVDLLSIVATDQDNATVTTLDGRAFVTTDGGESWARAPGF